jgi:hypothetical protein
VTPEDFDALFDSFRSDAGEQIRIVTRAELDDDGPDFWLFDAGTAEARGVVMHYSDDYRWLGADLVTDSVMLAELDRRRQTALANAVPLNEFLARVRRS